MTVVKIVELIGSSPNSWEEAAGNAMREAAKTVRNIKGVDLKRCTAKVEKIRSLNIVPSLKLPSSWKEKSNIGFFAGFLHILDLVKSTTALGT